MKPIPLSSRLQLRPKVFDWLLTPRQLAARLLSRTWGPLRSRVWRRSCWRREDRQIEP